MTAQGTSLRSKFESAGLQHPGRSSETVADRASGLTTLSVIAMTPLTPVSVAIRKISWVSTAYG